MYDCIGPPHTWPSSFIYKVLQGRVQVISIQPPQPSTSNLLGLCRLGSKAQRIGFGWGMVMLVHAYVFHILTHTKRTYSKPARWSRKCVHMYIFVSNYLHIYIYIHLQYMLHLDVFRYFDVTKKRCPVWYLRDEICFDGKAIGFVKHGSVQVLWRIIAID